VKGSDGNSQTLTATGAAVAQLSHVKAGESVRVAVDGTNATRIVKAPAKPASKKK
jgi:antitoxin (DNA-binding transcriptional repressor) of toxin-antitoxin stability system